MEQEAVAKHRGQEAQPRAAVASASAGAGWAALPSHSSFDWAGGGADKIDILFGKKRQIAEILPLTSEMLRILGQEFHMDRQRKRNSGLRTIPVVGKAVESLQREVANSCQDPPF